MGNSSSSSNLPPIADQSRMEKISNSLDYKQSLAMYGRDLSSSNTKSTSSSDFSFWLCSVLDKGKTALLKSSSSADSSFSSSSSKPASDSDTLISCCGTNTEDGDIKFWMIGDYNKKYQVRPASESELEKYIEDGQKTQGKYYTSSKIPFFLLFYPPVSEQQQQQKTTSSENDGDKKKKTARMFPEHAVRNDLYKNSGVHPYLNKDEENKWGVYGVRVIRDYGEKANKGLEKMLK